jgi:hypothetical protein
MVAKFEISGTDVPSVVTGGKDDREQTAVVDGVSTQFGMRLARRVRDHPIWREPRRNAERTRDGSPGRRSSNAWWTILFGTKPESGRRLSAFRSESADLDTFDPEQRSELATLRMPLSKTYRAMVSRTLAIPLPQKAASTQWEAIAAVGIANLQDWTGYRLALCDDELGYWGAPEHNAELCITFHCSPNPMKALMEGNCNVLKCSFQ